MGQWVPVRWGVPRYRVGCRGDVATYGDFFSAVYVT